MGIVNEAARALGKLAILTQGTPDYECYVCKGKIKQFVPFRGGSASIPPFILELDIIGSDVDHFNCPACKCHDRERHLFMFFDRLGLWPKEGAHVLHIAPERKVSEAFRQRTLAEYVRGDLFPANADITRVDITDIDFPDNHFDLIICNHVLEHVPDDCQAMREMHRVLKPGGHAVMQTPYSGILAASFRDENINTDERRLRFYGQEDHVRVYGEDLFLRIANSGFTLQIKHHKDVLSDIDPAKFGVNFREPLILATK